MAISLHALSGEFVPETMKLIGTIHSKRVVMLVDIGATHNFMDCRKAERLAMCLESGIDFSVRVANGDLIEGTGRCSNVQLRIQGMYSKVDFHLLSLGGLRRGVGH
ncbi:hypothetical protein LINPERPRIM_LOCUS20157 [Linum perenne]